MPFFLLIGGIIILTVAVRGNQGELIDLIRQDFTGATAFPMWILVFVILIGIGQNKTLRPITDTFLVLILIVVFLAAYARGENLFKSFYKQFTEGFSNG